MEVARDMRDQWDLKVLPDDPNVDNWTDRLYAWHYGKLLTDEQKSVWDAFYNPRKVAV
jgi:hypothetical protein